MELPDISENLKEARENAGFTQERLAEISGISKAYINRIENNRVNNISLYVAFNLSKSLNVSLDYLIGEKPIDQSEMEQLILLLKNEPQDVRDEFIRFSTMMLKRNAILNKQV